jgi:hypothetical protein
MSQRGAKNSFYGRKHTEETKAKIRAAKLGRPAPWVVESNRRRGTVGFVSESAAHEWLKRNHPKEGACQSCGKIGPTDYAFRLHGSPYTKSRDDYIEECRSCHVKRDRERDPSTGRLLSPLWK